MDLVLENGEKVSCKIIAKVSNNDIDYIIYDDGKDILASRYIVENSQIKLLPIEKEEEWDFIDEYLNNGVLDEKFTN